MSARFLAVDWGTTNLRAWVVGDNGAASNSVEFPLGVGKIPAGEAAREFAATVRPRMDAQELPAFLCGMVGSNLGWASVPYLDSPLCFSDLQGHLHKASTSGPPAWIVPGVRCVRPDGGPDVMRGEETQLLGWLSMDPARSRGEYLICQPGTHSKWVRVVDGQLQHFVTSMTGELFDVLVNHSVLQVTKTEENPSAFDAGVEAAGDGGALASRLFTARARVVGGSMPPTHVHSYLSGILIGAEVAGVPSLLRMSKKTPVTVIGDARLSNHYLRALRTHGYTVSTQDGEAAALSGLSALANDVLAR